MPRCDCAGSRCTCAVVAGEGIEVTGSGEANNPYRVEATSRPISDLLFVEDTTSLDLEMTGQGTENEPYIISGTVVPGFPASIAGFIEAGENITIIGSGTRSSPYVISGEGASTIAGLMEAGTNVVLTGSGTIEDPYIVGVSSDIVPDSITGLVEAGQNITLTGDGTTASPYIVAATGSSIEDLINAGTGVELTGSGTTLEPYTINVSNLRMQDLVDTAATNPGTSDVLTWNGDAWAAGPPTYVPQDPEQRGQYMRTATVTWDPPALNPGDLAQVNVTVPDVDYFDPWIFHVGKVGMMIGLFAWAEATAIDRVTIYLVNLRSDSAINLPSSDWTVYGWR